MKPWKWVLLIFELALFAVILILPQVDLPEFTFHGGNTPVSAKDRTAVRPSVTAAIIFANNWLPVQFSEINPPSARPVTSDNSEGRLSLLCTLIC
jgi:hypothetical protein